jgi:hypothetical protein
VLPIAFVVGSIGFYIESKLSDKRREIPYLNKSVIETRMDRQLLEGNSNKTVTANTLFVNKGRSDT